DDGVSEDEDQMDGEGGEDGVAGDWGDAEAGGSGDADDGRGEDQVGEADGGEEDRGCGVTEEQAAAGDGAAEALAEKGGDDGVGDVAGMEHLVEDQPEVGRCADDPERQAEGEDALV